MTNFKYTDCEKGEKIQLLKIRNGFVGMTAEFIGKKKDLKKILCTAVHQQIR